MSELRYGTKEYFKKSLDGMNLDEYIEYPEYLSPFTVGLIEDRLKDLADAGGDITPYVKKYEKIKEKNTEYFQSLSEEDQKEYIQRGKDQLQGDLEMGIFPGQRELGIENVPMETDLGVIIPAPEKDIFDIEGFKDNYGYRTDVATGGLIKRVGLKGGRDAAQSDFSPGPGAVTSDAGFENDSPSQVTSINIADKPVFDIKKTGDPSLNPKSKNQRDDDRFSGYSPSFIKDSIFKTAGKKFKGFMGFAKPIITTIAMANLPIPTKVKQGIGLFRTLKAIPEIAEQAIEDDLENTMSTVTGGINPQYKGLTLNDNRENFRFGSRGYQGSRASGVQRPGFSAPSKQGQSPRGSSSSRPKTTTKKSKGGGGGSTITQTVKALTNVPIQFGKAFVGNLKSPGSKVRAKLTAAQLTRLNDIIEGKGTPSGQFDYSDYGSPTKTFSGIGGMSPLDASLATTIGAGRFTTDPKTGKVNITGDTYDFTPGASSITDFINRGGIAGTQPVQAIFNFGQKLGERINQKDGTNPKEIPIRSNKYGVKELDYRKSGGFVPIGIKEKADDVPAMLSKNEFVFTADAVRGAGNGSINKGAQRMYNLMKNLEARKA
tara:strand:- start:839 stop:2641 length:1803 start_codon:yes stop_codon:yes gene_type:complete